jgi:hypothetical protein
MNDQHPNTLPEYAKNPFISCLPGIRSRHEIAHALVNRPHFEESERRYPSHIRKHCIVRLIKYYEPLARQIQLYERFDLILKLGYTGRDPSETNYIHQLQNSHERNKQGSLDAPPKHMFENYAQSFALLGTSGGSKTRTLERILRCYPQIVRHETPYHLTQIVWIRLDCPSKKGTSQLCQNFFYSVDRLLGTNYEAKYAGKGQNDYKMLINMAHVANLHAIGCLVIDEVQFLILNQDKAEETLAFLVTLVNTIGIPVILVGTNSAIPLIQKNFKEARRAIGLGNTVWDAYENNAVWQSLVEKLWKYQWLNTYTPLTKELSDTIYYYTQGVIDILIKLFILIQIRLISVHEQRKGEEIITPGLIQQVANENLKLVEPMLNALRNKDMKALARYDDLLPFQSHFDKIVKEALDSHSVTDWVPAKPAPLHDAQDDVNAQLTLSLKLMGIAEDVIKLIVEKVLSENPNGDMLTLMAAVISELKKTKTGKKQSASRLKLVAANEDINDLRLIVKREGSETPYQKLLAAGMIRFPVEERFA